MIKSQSYSWANSRGDIFACSVISHFSSLSGCKFHFNFIALNSGKYLHDVVESSNKSDFCIGVAGYPEKHIESPSLQSDLKRLKEKVDAGADYVVTQMFFDNNKYFAFVDRCRRENITIPIIPGIKILDKPRQIETLPKMFNIKLPDELHNEAVENIEHIQEIGTRWAIKQSEELINAGVPIIHYYLMNDTSCMLNILNHLHK